MKDSNFCVWCGFKLGPDDDFCSNCGAKVADMVIKREEIKVKPKKVKRKSKYEARLSELKDKYEYNEKEARRLVEKRFQPPQMTYYKFANELDDSRVLFYKKLENANEIVEAINDGILDENATNVKEKLESIIGKLELIIERVNELISEFIISSSSDENDDKDLEDLFKNMDDLIDSVKKYQ